MAGRPAARDSPNERGLEPFEAALMRMIVDCHPLRDEISARMRDFFAAREVS